MRQLNKKNFHFGHEFDKSVDFTGPSPGYGKKLQKLFGSSIARTLEQHTLRYVDPHCVNADPDPDFFFLNADPDPGQQNNSVHEDPNPGPTLKLQKVEFLHGKYKYLKAIGKKTYRYLRRNKNIFERQETRFISKF